MQNKIIRIMDPLQEQTSLPGFSQDMVYTTTFQAMNVHARYGTIKIKEEPSYIFMAVRIPFMCNKGYIKT